MGSGKQCLRGLSGLYNMNVFEAVLPSASSTTSSAEIKAGVQIVFRDLICNSIQLPFVAHTLFSLLASVCLRLCSSEGS